MELNVENRHQLVNAVTITSLQISWLQSIAANPVVSNQPLLQERLSNPVEKPYHVSIVKYGKMLEYPT